MGQPLPFRSGIFDSVISIGALHYLTGPPPVSMPASNHPEDSSELTPLHSCLSECSRVSSSDRQVFQMFPRTVSLSTIIKFYFFVNRSRIFQSEDVDRAISAVKDLRMFGNSVCDNSHHTSKLSSLTIPTPSPNRHQKRYRQVPTVGTLFSTKVHQSTL